MDGTGGKDVEADVDEGAGRRGRGGRSGTRDGGGRRTGDGRPKGPGAHKHGRGPGGAALTGTGGADPDRSGPPDRSDRSEDRPEGDSIAGVLTGVGPRLRALRRESGLTLAQLGETTGISVSTLSRLESGGRKPTLELLLPLARAYQVPLDQLVGAPATGDPRVFPRPFTQNGQTIVPLTRYLGGMHAYKHIMPARKEGALGVEGAARPPRPRQSTHEGYEWVYVLSGRLWLALADHDLVLGAGEAAEFDTHTPHGFTNAGTVPVEFISLFGAQGERMHVRARPARGRG